ncbi:MAG: ATP-binding response regulator [Desulfuromonadaceae bacterium]
MTDNSLLNSDISLLYVEDDATTRRQVSRALAARGYRLTVAENGEQGLALFRDQTYDIVLTDIMMPGVNGLEMAREIRSLSPDIQIACMTAFSDTDLLIEAIEIGINQFVLKPVKLSRLFTALDRCQKMVELQRHQQSMEAEQLRAKKSEAVAILAGGMAHDFNNLLQVVFGYISLARMNEKTGSKTDSLLAVIEESSEKASNLGKQLRMLGSGCCAQMKPDHIGELLKDEVTAELSTTSITQTVDLPDGLPLVKLDKSRIQQVISHLVANARDAMPEGGVLYVSVSTANLPAVNTFGLPQGNYLQVIFKDTGPGIRPEHLPRIFDPYFSTKEMGCRKGSGLGLSLCYAIIKSHNGHIQAESEPGNGTRIRFHLPVYEPD